MTTFIKICLFAFLVCGLDYTGHVNSNCKHCNTFWLPNVSQGTQSRGTELRYCLWVPKILWNVGVLRQPGHSDIIGNCKANKHARLVTTLQISTEFAMTGVPLGACDHIINNAKMNSANERWAASDTCKTERKIWQMMDGSLPKL